MNKRKSRESAAELLYQTLIEDAWNCYREPQLYNERFGDGGAIQRKWWEDLVEKVQYGSDRQRKA